MSVTIKLRGNTEAYWQSANPVPADREVILSTDKGNFKVGDGATAWASLGYWLPDDLTSVIKIVGGSVGINENEPGRKFVVVHTLSGSLLPAIRVQNADNINGTATGIAFSSHASLGSLAYDKAGIFFERATSFGRGNLHLCNDIAADSDNVALSDAKITINANGNIGIGVTSPSTRLDIGSGAIEIEEMTPPASPAANNIRLYAKDNGSGKTQLCVKFSDGTETVLATQP